MKKLNIKVGISDFAEIRDSGCYYIDKSGLISDLLQNNTAKVTLITTTKKIWKNIGNEYVVLIFWISESKVKNILKDLR